MCDKFINKSSWPLCKRTNFHRPYLSGAIGQKVSGNIEVNIRAYIPSRIGINVLLTVPFLQKDKGWVYDIILLNMSYNGLHNTKESNETLSAWTKNSAVYFLWQLQPQTQKDNRHIRRSRGVKPGPREHDGHPWPFSGPNFSFDCLVSRLIRRRSFVAFTSFFSLCREKRCRTRLKSECLGLQLSVLAENSCLAFHFSTTL